ncbi:PIN domain-containing protein [endosymbiont of Tevnia jerichonana]|uniref:PIN domain-containing protein n=1 Tax=endosymbiont of Tevnia jerichonana TaxID=94785 RepID=UPI0011100E31|nr:PIN domain-containing protein [endosymbiont of Tevnia jerichonana]
MLDSNIWLSELGLNTAKGAATRFYIKQKQAKLVLPEIVKEEVERNLFNSLVAYSNDIQKNHRQLLTVFGQLKEVVLPSENDIRTKAKGLFDEVKVELHEIPFTLESARSSLNKINDKKPPSDKNQQFKDGVIWADCMSLLNEDDVYLVTEDKAFFRDRNYKNGLAGNLREEADSFPKEIRIYPSLSGLLEELKTDVNIDNDALVSCFTKTIADSMNSILDRNGFSISSEATVNISPFVTEDPDKIYIEFEISFECADTRDEVRTDGMLLLKGDGYYISDRKEFHELRNRGEELSFNDGSEERKNVNHVILAGYIVIGHRDVEHSIRYKIDQ